MSLADQLRFELARVTIETRSPLLIGVEGGDGFHDALFTTDANGLPTIPGESLAGILRHALAEGRDPSTAERCKKAFGYQDGDTGDSSAVEISWAQVHGSDDRPVAFRGATLDDEVLAFLAAGAIRDHVRLDMNGVAYEGAKFDELVVPAGARFTFEIRVLERAGLPLHELLRFLDRPETAIGRGSRRGLGHLAIVRAVGRKFDLTRPEDRKIWETLPVAVHLPLPRGYLEPLDHRDKLQPPAGGAPEPIARQWHSGVLELSPMGTWYVGGTIDPGLPDRPRKDGTLKTSDRFPMAERFVTWEGGQGRVSARHRWLLPASSLKGALRHRVAFHARRLSRQFAPGDASSPGWAPEASHPFETYWFGQARGDDELDAWGRERQGPPGRVMLSDACIDMAESPDKDLHAFDHVSLDRFTHGPIDGRLFDELALNKPGLKLKIPIAVADSSATPEERAALAAALQDLCEGRLWIGAAGSRGHGELRGSIKWDGPDPLARR